MADSVAVICMTQNSLLIESNDSDEGIIGHHSEVGSNAHHTDLSAHVGTPNGVNICPAWHAQLNALINDD